MPGSPTGFYQLQMIVMRGFDEVFDLRAWERCQALTHFGFHGYFKMEHKELSTQLQLLDVTSIVLGQPAV